MKRVIVTGATGFVGANLTRKLLAEGHEVHALVRPGYARWRIEDIRRELRLHEADLGDQKALLATVGAVRPEWVFHLAVYGAYSWQTDGQQMVRTNIIGTMNLAEVCLKTGFESFVNTGSSSEYGFKDHAPVESECLEPNSRYAVTKATATQLCTYLSRSRNRRIVTLRLYSVYGPFEEPGRLLPELVVHGLRGSFPPLANPDTARDFVYVDDAVDAYLRAASAQSAPGPVYNVGSGEQVRMRKAVAVAKEVLNVPGEPSWGTYGSRSWDTGTWVADIHKIRDELGWSPRHSFEQGLRATVDWFNRHEELHDFYRQRPGQSAR